MQIYKDKIENFRVIEIKSGYGSALILKNNKPRYIITEFSQVEEISPPSDEELKEISDQLIKRNAKVYEELAK